MGRAETMTMVAPGPVAELLARAAPTLVLQGMAAVCDREGLGIRIASRAEGARGPMLLLRPAPGTQAPAVPAVVVDGVVAGAMAVNADVDAAAAEIRDHLAALGHRRLGIVGWRGEQRRAGALAVAWREVGPVVTIQADGLAAGDGEVAAAALLGRTPRPTVVVAVADGLALGALDGARRLGLSVPGELSVAGIDDIPGSGARGLTTAFVPYAPMGELAATLAIRQLERRELGSPPPPLPAPLAIRATTGRAP
jgi:DNA-binding LacI/PurR family transcriptional regulator